jgi:3-oxoacyl-[acyl-carrier-protein] synthase II
MNTVVITGISTINAVGNDKETVFTSLLEAKSGISKITHYDASLDNVQIAGEVKGFNVDSVLDKKEQKKCDRFVQLGLYAAKQALDDAKLNPEEIDTRRIGVSGASGIGGLPMIQNNIESNKDKKRVSPFFIPGTITNMLSGYVSIKHKLYGPNLSSTTACTAGLHAINEAAKTIMIGSADAMLVVGAEATICQSGIRGFSTMKALSTNNENPQQASRPFDKHRDGFVMGEGAAGIMLESLDHALKRGARIYATIEGFGESADASHITTPSLDGPVRAMNEALSMAKQPTIDYINAHGTSTPLGDVNETNAFKKVFSDVPPLSSIKGSTGHCLGATGTIEAVVALMALERNIMPPTINLETQDEECDLDYIPNRPRQKELSHVMSVNYGFGGTNGAIIFKKYLSNES